MTNTIMGRVAGWEPRDQWSFVGSFFLDLLYVWWCCYQWCRFLMWFDGDLWAYIDGGTNCNCHEDEFIWFRIFTFKEEDSQRCKEKGWIEMEWDLNIRCGSGVNSRDTHPFHSLVLFFSLFFFFKRSNREIFSSITMVIANLVRWDVLNLILIYLFYRTHIHFHIPNHRSSLSPLFLSLSL